MRRVPIVFLTDENYTIPTGVSICSLIENYRSLRRLLIYIIAANITEESIKAFKKFNSLRVQIKIITVDNNFTKKFDKVDNYVTGTVLMKFDIAQLLPKHDKVLYLDGDTLIQKDITSLCTMELGSAYAAVVTDIAGMDAFHLHENLGLKQYFNAGVILLNTKKIREEGLREKMYQHNEEHPEYPLLDQDVMNVMFQENVKYLPLKYNAMIYNHIHYNSTLEVINTYSGYQYSSIEELEEDAVILHLTNEKKPWWYQDAYMADRWHDYFKKTPFRDRTLTYKC